MNYLEVRERAKARREFMRAHPHLTAQELAKELGMHEESVRAIAKKYKIKIARANNRKAAIEDRIAFVKKNPDMTAREIADALKMSTSSTYYLVKTYALEIKPVNRTPKHTTEERVAFIKANPDKTSAEIAKALDDKPVAISQISRLYDLDIKRRPSAKKPEANYSSRLIEKRNALLMKKWA